MEQTITTGDTSPGTKTALITGAQGNLGQAIVDRFLRDGYQVTGTISPRETATPEAADTRLQIQTADLADEAAAANLVAGVINSYGHLDAAVHTVGGFAMGDVSATSAKDIEKQVKLNFETAYNVARPVFLHMMNRKAGRIFLVGSRPGLLASAGKGMVAYSLAKSLIFHLAVLLNDEAKGTNVVTSVIVPSTIDTPQNRSSMPKGNFDSWVKPEKIADVVSFYCSEAASALREPIIKVYNSA